MQNVFPTSNDSLLFASAFQFTKVKSILNVKLKINK